MCTYMFCGLSGPVDILLANGRAPLAPRGADYAALLISFVGEGLVLHVHTQGRPPLDVLVHELLVYVIVAQAACLCAEMVHRSSVVVALTRGYCAILQVRRKMVIYNNYSGHDDNIYLSGLFLV
ncbi:hypothetical protein HPB48_013798 [Haemaphysalis longicornis]|uniref:Uncharacterized protein n=1 Tax=Haemaphysalis longicornis TaxID=44386 RepID=A0A9J6GN93_HAELO|nr:hypothetical protein HPB48_013798 [Haemaphysalis longicornis]